jgi:hypothetical protein
MKAPVSRISTAAHCGLRKRVQAAALTGLPAAGSLSVQSPEEDEPPASLPDDRSLMNPIIPAPRSG